MQKEIKRFTLIALAVGLVCVLLAGSALAFAPVFASWLGDSIGARSFNDDVLSRYITISGTPKYQRSVPSWTDVKNFTLDSEYQFDLPFDSLPGQANTKYLFSDSWGTAVPYRFRLSAGSFIDVQTPVSYLAADYSTLSVSGSGEFALTFGNPMTTYPAQRVALLVNGNVVASTETSLDSYNRFTLPVVSLDLSTYGDVESLGYRFYYDTGDYVLSGLGTGKGAYVYLYYNDTGFVVPSGEKEPEYKLQLDVMLGYLRNISGNTVGIVPLLDQISSSLSSISGTNGIQAIVRILDPSTEGSVGNTISNIGSIYASSEDIQLKEGTKDFASAATDLMIGDSEDGSSGLLGSDSVSNVKDLKKIGNAIKSWFSFDVDIGELFTSVDSGASDWFSSDTATGIDSVGSIQSAAVDDDSDPYNMQDYYDFIDSLFAKYGGGVND